MDHNIKHFLTLNSGPWLNKPVMTSFTYFFTFLKRTQRGGPVTGKRPEMTLFKVKRPLEENLIKTRSVFQFFQRDGDDGALKSKTEW